MIQKRRKYYTNLHNRSSLPDRTGAARSWAASESPPRCPPHRNPAWRHTVWNTGLCLAMWCQTPPPGCAPSCSPVKINPVLAKPRTGEHFACLFTDSSITYPAKKKIRAQKVLTVSHRKRKTYTEIHEEGGAGCELIAEETVRVLWVCMARFW